MHIFENTTHCSDMLNIIQICEANRRAAPENKTQRKKSKADKNVCIWKAMMWKKFTAPNSAQPDAPLFGKSTAVHAQASRGD